MSFKSSGTLPDGLVGIHPGDNQNHMSSLYERTNK